MVNDGYHVEIESLKFRKKKKNMGKTGAQPTSYLVDLWKKFWIPRFQARWRGKKSGAAWKFHDFLWKVVDFLRLKSGGGVAWVSRQVKHLPGGKTAWEIPEIYISMYFHDFLSKMLT